MSEPPKDPPAAHSSAYSNEISVAVQTKLLETLIEQPVSILIGLLSCTAIALFGYYYSHQSWLLLWALSLLFLLVCRLWLSWFYRRHKAARAPQVWVHRFAIGGILTSLTMGIASASSIMYGDPFLQMLLITAEISYVTAAVIRNNAVPRVAALQGVIPLLCSSASCIATGNKFYIIFAIFAALNILALFHIIRFLYKKTLFLLLAEERLAAAAEDLTEANARLQALAATDQLTGLMNRRGFEIALAAGCNRASRFNEEFSLLLLDIDHFKMLNDTHGHQVGDDCLRQVGACLRTLVRADTDGAARYGGEEFAILMPGTNYFDAGQAAGRVRAAIEALAFPHPASPFGVATVSVGYASYERNVLEESSEIVKAADKALYSVKRKSRNAIAGCREPEKPGARSSQAAAS